ncbi:MAG: prepilin-type N-terminal cleavage/methylation domain-containing protein [Candidatus Scalindua sp.]|nr:prepilin-type N-terminal cleavage/methylation domain-containing protein [Candidatus Scalindua sp.]
MTRRNSEDSFTLVETLVVLAIVAVIGVATVPKITAAIDTVRFRGAVSELITFLRKTHLEAILQRKNLEIVIDFENNSLKIDDERQFVLPAGMALEPKEQYTSETMKYRFFYNGRGTGPEINIRGENERKATVYVDLLSGLAGYDLSGYD